MEFIEVILWMEKEKDMVLFNGTMVKNSRATGKMVLNVALAYGDHQKEIVMKVNGSIIGNMGKVFSSIEIVYIRVNLKIFWNMVKVLKHF